MFNIYAGYVIKKICEKHRNIRYLADILIFIDSLNNLQCYLSTINDVGTESGPELRKKIKSMIINKNIASPKPLMIDTEEIERILKVNYDGTNINTDWDHLVEIRCRIEKARTA